MSSASEPLRRRSAPLSEKCPLTSQRPAAAHLQDGYDGKDRTVPGIESPGTRCAGGGLTGAATLESGFGVLSKLSPHAATDQAAPFLDLYPAGRHPYASQSSKP